MNIHSIRYKYGFLNKLSDRKKLANNYLIPPNIPENILSLIEENELMALNGTFGIKEGTHPVEYDSLRIQTEGNHCEIEVYNKGASLIMEETPELKRIFPVCCKLQELFRL